MIALTAEFAGGMRVTELDRCIRDVSAALKDEDERVAYVYVRPVAAAREDPNGAARSPA